MRPRSFLRFPVLFGGLALAMGCEPEARPRRRRYVLAPEVDAALADATVPTGLCPRRATRGLDLAVAPGCTRAAVAWNGSHYGVAWQQATPGGTAVWFARVQPTGDRAGAAVQVSADGFRVGYPAVVWNGANWSVLFDAAWGAGEGDVQQARVDVRGAVVSAPWRMTRGPRDDVAAAIAGSGQGFGLAWVAREDAGRRHVLYGMSLDRWDAPRGQAVRLIDTGLTLAAPTVTWTGEEWAFTAVSGRGETRAVEFMRLSPEGQPRGVLRHVSPERIGGVELDGRHAIAWDGRAFGLAWSELRDGAQRVFVRRVSTRGNPFGGDVTASEGAASAHEPALVTVAPGVFALAFRVERDGGARVSVRTVDVDGGRLSPVSELQGPDGSAGAPAMAFDGHGVGVATVSPRGVAFHRVEFGPCAGSQRPYAPAVGASPSAAPPYIVSAMR